MRLGLGKLGLTSRDFWALSWREFMMACEGFADFHTPKSKMPKPPTKAESEDIMRRAEALLRQQGKL